MTNGIGKAAMFALVLASGAAQAFAQRAASDDWTSLTTRIDRAVLEDDGVALKSVRGDVLRLLVPSPPGDRASLVHYAVAYVDLRLAFGPTLSEREQEDLLDEAEQHLERALKIQPQFAEAMGLLSGVLGAKIAKSPMKGITLGPRSNSLIDEALAIAPDNPRLLLSKGIGKFNTPAAFGGSDREAEALIRRALTNFDKEGNSRPWPNWGRFDAHAWLGKILAGRGDKAGARAEYQKALAIAPNSAWIKYVLMPAVNK